MRRDVMCGARALRLLCVFVASFPVGAKAASAPANGSIRVAVRAATALPADGIYLALIPLDRSPGKPLREVVAPAANAELSAPSGTYVLMTAANGFQTDLRE
jgi:hypothetical protein